MPAKRVQQSNTSSNLSVSPQNSGPPAVRPSPSLPSFTRSASPSGISNFFSRPTKWFSRTASATKPSPTEPRSSTSSVASGSRRRPTISGPSDPRPIEDSGSGPINGGQIGVGGLAALSEKGSRSVLDLSRASVEFNTAADSGSLGDLRAISKKAWSRSADNLASAPLPKLSPLNTTSLEARIEQYRTGTPGSTPISTNQQKTYPFPSLPVTPSTPPKGSTVHQLRHAHSTSGASISPASAVASPNTHLAPPSPKQSHPARKRSFDVDRVREKTSSNANAAVRSPFPFNFHSNGSSSKSPSPSTPTIVEPTEPVAEDTKRASQIVHRSGLVNRLQNFSMTSPQLSSSKNWKAYKMVLKGSKLYFYKPPSDRAAAIKDLFPSGLVITPEGDEPAEDEPAAGTGKERDDTKKKRAFWGRRTHPELVLTEGTIEKGTLESLVHEAVFGTTFSSCSLTQGGWWSFASSVLLCLPILAGQSKFEYEFIRCSTYLVSGAEESQQDAMRERVSSLASKYLGYHGSPADEEGWKTFCKDTIPASNTDATLPKTPRPARHQTSFSDVSPNLNTFSPRPADKERTASLSNTFGPQTPLSRHNTLSPVRSVKSAASKARVWQALDQEGFTREVFLRLDSDTIIQSLILYHRSILASVPSLTAGVLLDKSSTTPLLHFFGCDETPNWLTRTIVMQILGPGHVSSREHQSPNGTGDGRGSLDGKHSAGTHVRSEVISKWAKIGESCRLAGDECSWQAIKAALCSRPIARLEKAWKRVDSHSLSAVRTWAYASPSGEHLRAREPVVSPWGGDKRTQAINLFAKDNNQGPWHCKAMESARHLFTLVHTSFDDCKTNSPRQGACDEDNIARLTQLWSESSAKSHAKYTRLEQFMSLSFAAEPKKKCLFSPHFWAKLPVSSQYALAPLSLVEPLPSITLTDRSQMNKKTFDGGNVSGDAPQTRLLELKRTMEINGIIRNNREVKAMDRHRSKFDLRGLVLPVFDGELLLYVASGPESATRPSSTVEGEVPPETPPGRSPSIRVKSAAAGLDRKSSRARRASLPALSQRSNRIMTDNAGETSLRAIVRAGTLDALVHFLVHGLEGVTVSVADDNGEMALSDKTTKSVKVDHQEFISVWWNTFRSFVSPYVFFQLLRKEYMTQSITAPSISDEDLSFGFKARLAVIKTVADWTHNGGGSQDALDDTELHQSIVSFLNQPAERDSTSVSSASSEIQRLCGDLDRERTILLQSFTAQSMRPNARHVQVRGSSSASCVHNFGVMPPIVDEISVEDFVDNIDAMGAAAFRNLVQEDLFVTTDILEVQTNDRTGWYMTKESSSSTDEIELQTLYTFLMDVEPTSLVSDLSGDSLYRLLPPGLRTLIRAFNILRKWAICLITTPQLGLPTRQARMELFLNAIELSRLRSVDRFDSFDDDEVIHQPCVRSFVEAILTSAILSPESRLFTRAWQNIAAGRNASAESLASLLAVRSIPNPNSSNRLTVDPAWIIERILDVISLPDVVESSLEMSLSQVNFDKRRQLCNVISNSSYYVSRGSHQRREMDRCDFERLNKIEQEFADISWDMRTLRDDAHREALYFRDGSYSVASGKKAIRPFYRSILLQQEKTKRDRHLRDRLIKEKKHEQQKLERREEDFSRAMEMRGQSSSGHKQHRSKRSMSALFSLMRPISTAFSLDSAGPTHQLKRSPSELDFTPSHKPAFVLSMVEARVAVFINNDRSYTFQLDTEDGGHYLLQALNRADMNHWISTINTTVRVHAQRRLTYLGNSGQMQFTDHLQQPRPTTASRDPTAVFGVDLEYLVHREANGGDVSPDAVPKVLELLLTEIEARGLMEQGIYRVAGATTEVTALREALNNGQSYIDKTTDIHSVCGVVKYWFRVLPETVIPEYLFDSAVEAAKLTDLDARLSEIRQLVRRLPRAHYTVLKRFAEHLDKVVDYEEKNHMTSDNLATVICPNLLRAPRNDFGLIMKNMGSIIVLFKALITHVNFIFSEDDIEEEEEVIEDGDGDATPGRLPTPDEAEEDEFNVPITSSPEPDEGLQDAMMLASPISPS